MTPEQARHELAAAIYRHATEKNYRSDHVVAAIEALIDAKLALCPKCERIKVLEKALRVFSLLGGPMKDTTPAFHDLEDDVVVFSNSGESITASDVRRARAALEVKP